MTEKEQKLEKLFKKWMEWHMMGWGSYFPDPRPFNKKYPEREVKGLSIKAFALMGS